MITHQDEILDRAVPGDATPVPRYDMRNPDGSLLAENISLELKNSVLQNGTPIDKATLDEFLSASGKTSGTSTAYTLAQDGFVLKDGAVIRFKLHVDSGATPTINVNGTGAKRIMMNTVSPMSTGSKAGLWYTAVYSEDHGFFVLQGSGVKYRYVTEIITESGTWTMPDNVRDRLAHVTLFGAGGGGGYPLNQSPSTAHSVYGGGGGGRMAQKDFVLNTGAQYAITIGKGGTNSGAGGTTSFGTLLSAAGGSGANSANGASGGSGGGGSLSAHNAEGSPAIFNGGKGGDASDFGGGGGASGLLGNWQYLAAANGGNGGKGGTHGGGGGAGGSYRMSGSTSTVARASGGAKGTYGGKGGDGQLKDYAGNSQLASAAGGAGTPITDVSEGLNGPASGGANTNDTTNAVISGSGGGGGGHGGNGGNAGNGNLPYGFQWNASGGGGGGGWGADGGDFCGGGGGYGKNGRGGNGMVLMFHDVDYPDERQYYDICGGGGGGYGPGGDGFGGDGGFGAGGGGCGGKGGDGICIIQYYVEDTAA